jgi:sulfite reductase alpha subunit-like flavoprotein
MSQISASSIIEFPEEGIRVDELFEYWLNINEPPSRYFFETLSYFAKNEMHAKRLLELSSSVFLYILLTNLKLIGIER